MKQSLMAVLWLTVAGMWPGCGREPIDPPNSAPPERVPATPVADPAPARPSLLLVDDRRRLG